MHSFSRLMWPFKDRVDVIVDVGVRKGTPELYQAFDSNPFILIDPQIGAESWLESSPKNYKFLNIGLGSKPGQLEFYEDFAKSSFLQRTALTADATTKKHIVKVDTLDNVVKSEKLEGRIGVKIDTEGYELEVIKGIKNCSAQIEFIICEASIRKRFEDSYEFSELVVEMHKRGFLFYNFFNEPMARPRFYDVMFLPVGHELFS